MPVDQSLVGRIFPPTRPHEVTETRIASFVAATAGAYDGGPAPATYPIVLAFDAMNAFLEAERSTSSGSCTASRSSPTSARSCPATCSPQPSPSASLRQIAGNDIIGTTSEITDESGALVCTTSATLVHRGAASTLA